MPAKEGEREGAELVWVALNGLSFQYWKSIQSILMLILTTRTFRPFNNLLRQDAYVEW